ncbi:MAG: PSD1 domain-containing protein [Verrucomicrobia bacterium]|nr:PSD1 domain-containing protein [Verrucomicrobiota bacterium]
MKPTPPARSAYGCFGAMLLSLLWFVLPVIAGNATARTKENPPTRKIDFGREIKPILARRCVTCHNAEKHKGGLRLDRRDEAVRGGESGQPVFPTARSAVGTLIERITTSNPDEHMPPKGKPLTDAQIALLKSWVQQGAPWPDTSNEKHWAFIPPVRPKVPEVKNKNWPRNPIDHFVLAKLEERGWEPSPAASPRAWLRRVYLDVIGLPPTLAEQEKFLKQPKARDFDQLIDDLLARPAYGERWARHWLDLVRYAESNGYERDATKPQVWRYRDYVIDSFNRDKPYNRFIREQLAGDELPDANAEMLIATGYHRLGPWDDEPADPLQDRADQIDDLIRTTSQVFLGLTLGCARCHDHKFDPLTAKDYYSMAAIFDGLQRPKPGRDDLDLPAGTREELAALDERDKNIAALRDEIARVRATNRVEFLKNGQTSLPSKVIAAFQTEAKQQTDEQKDLIGKNSKQLEDEIAATMPETVKQKIAECDERIIQLQKQTPDLPRAYFLREPSSTPPKTHLLLRGRAANPGPEMQPAVPVVLTSNPLVFLPPDEHTTRRRLSLANWIASPENPLTARVIVNRVWQYHFGEGLVATPSDFGTAGNAPTHPELLDWLADWFTHEGEWSFKKLHRLILSSSTYRMSKAWNPKYGETDPENQLLWRFPYRRLEVEAIRDSMLVVSGQLNPKMRGPSMYPFVPKDALEGHSDPDKIWPAFDETESSRRTIYAFVKRSLVVPMLEVLDLCDSTQSAEKRSITSIAPQALTLFNGDFVNRQARHLATRLQREVGDDVGRQIERAYLLALCRPPTLIERKTLRNLVEKETAVRLRETGNALAPTKKDAARREALVQMCRVILNLNEFVYSD